jgi:(1->4)-alpha-D-glucan 1-alpha-D-glucosylmutase
MDLSLVDPDNRRPVDYALRERWLVELITLQDEPGLASSLSALAAAPHDGRAKLWLTWRLLGLHRQWPLLFCRGNYTALAVRGAAAGHALAYARHHDGVTLVVVAGRLWAQLGEPGKLPLGEALWSDTTVKVPLPEGWLLENLLSGETLRVEQGRIRIADAFASFPAAVFAAKATPPGA